MLSKSMILFLGTILLLQSYNAERFKDMDSAVLCLRERLKLFRLVHNEINEMTKKIFRDSSIVIEKMLKDPTILEVKSVSMQSKLDEFRDFIKTFDEFDKNGKYSQDDIRRVRSKFDHIATKYDEKKEPLENSEDKIIAGLLKENGFVGYGEPNLPLIKSFVEKFLAEVQNYIDQLNETEKKDECNLLELMEVMKAEPDVKKSGSSMIKFFENLQLEDFLW